MRCDYYFCQLYNAKLISFLDEKGINYRITNIGKTFSNGTPIPNNIIFTIKGYSDTVEKLVNSYRCSPHISVKYSATEINGAEVLMMTPRKQVVEIVNPETAYSYSCTWIDSRGIERAHHKEQIGTVQISKEPPLNTQTAIWASLSFSEVFVDKRVYDMVLLGSYSDLGFEKVKLSNGTYSENIYQLKPQALISQDSIDFEKGYVEMSCPICGKKQYGMQDPFQLRVLSRNCIKGSDSLVTERIFGHGIAQPLYLVSQHFYQELKKNKLAANVNFEPVILLDK